MDARGLNVGFGDPIGPRVFPYLVGTGMVVLAILLAVATARGDIPQGEEGEDIDLTTPADWVTVGKLVAIMVINLLLVNILGWAITGTLLFAGSAWALGSRTLIRDILVGAVLVGEQLVLLLRRSRSPADSGDPGRDPLMDTLNLLADGFQNAFTLENLMYATIGVLLGTFVGVLPGIGPAMALALLLPVTYGLDVTQSLIMFAGIYYGGMYGGSTTSILLNTPGESASVMTAIEGNRMAKRGRAAQALATAAIGSFIAGTIGTLLVAFFAPSIADWAVEIGAPTFFAIMLLSLVLVSSVLGGSKLRGFIGLFIGLTIGLVGLDLSTGQARLTGGSLEARRRYRHRGCRGRRLRDRRSVVDRCSSTAPSRWRCSRSVSPSWVATTGDVRGARGCGEPRSGSRSARCLPAAPRPRPSCPTSPSASWPATSQGASPSAKAPSRVWRDPRRPTTRVRPACSYRCSRSAYPVTATAAVLLAAMQTYGIQPGPTLMTDQPDLIWTLLASLLIGNTLLLVINLPLAPVWAKLLRIPRPQLYAGILFFASLGAYSVNQDPVRPRPAAGLRSAWASSIRRFGIPVLPLILGVILGPLMEVKLREALDISDGDVSGLFNEPLAVAIYVVIVLALVVPILLGQVPGRRPIHPHTNETRR